MNRRGSGVVICLGLLTLGAPGVGESDKSQPRAIGSIRAIVSAEAAYADVHGGRFATLDRLYEPAGHPSDVPSAPFLSPDVAATPEHDGYRFAFYPNPDLGPQRDSSAMLTRFAVVAVPVNVDRRRSRGFCADDRGIVYVTDSAVAPRVEGGRCLDTREPLH